MEKVAFASTLNDHDNEMPKGRSECFDYGSWYGCNCDCPVFQRGECECEDPEAFAAMIDDECLNKEDKKRYYKLYPQLLKYKNKIKE